MKLGRLPHELLEATDSAELADIFSYYAIQAEAEKAQREGVQTGEQMEEAWRHMLTRPQVNA